VGVCYFWPTMLGFVSERIPRSGALGLGLMGTVGMATVGLVTAPWMGQVADRFAHAQLPADETVAVLYEASSAIYSQSLVTAEAEGADLQNALAAVQAVLESAAAEGALPPGETANALRSVISSGSTSSVVDRASALLGPAENYGGLVSFRYVVPLCGLLVLVFGGLLLRERRSGGYHVQRI